MTFKRFFTSLQVLIWVGAAFASSHAWPSHAQDQKNYRKWIEQAAEKKDFSTELAHIVKADASVDPILEDVLLSSSQRWEARWFSAIALGQRDNEYAKKALLKGLNDPLFIIRQASTKALSYRDDLDTLKAIRASLHDSAMVVRSEAVDALVKRQDQFAASFLADELFKDRNYTKGKSLWIRPQIVQAFGKLGQPEGVDPLIRVLTTSSSNKDLRYQACTSLETIARKNQWNFPTAPKAKCTAAWLAWHKERETEKKPDQKS